MLRRTVKIQLILFVAITLAGVSYVGGNYAGLFHGLSRHACTVEADFQDASGIFSGAEVTYLGVGVGRVGKLHLIHDGARVDLHIDDCDKPQIPADTDANVADRSIIGEQYVDLVPASSGPPYLADGSVIPKSRTSIPLQPGTLLADVNGFVTTVDTGALRTTLQQLGDAFQVDDTSLGRLVNAGNALLSQANENLPQTLALTDKAGGVLDTQLAENDSLQTFSQSLRLLSQQLRSSNPDVQKLIDRSPGDLGSLRRFITTNRTDLGLLLSQLTVTGNLLVERLPDIRQILILYPLLPGGAMSAMGADGVAKTALVPNVNDPPDCTSGYGGTVHHSPSYTGNPAPNLSAHCAPPAGSGTEVRGSQNVPDPAPMAR